MINKKKAIKKCVLPCILSATLLSTVVTPINARVNETFNPVRNLRFTSEVTTGQTASKDKTKLNTDIKYSDDKSSATMTITSPDGYNLSLTDACKESYKSFLDDGTVVLQDENTSKFSVVTNYKNIYRLEINVKNTDNTLVETQNIDFQVLDITSVQNESLQEELNIANANSRTTSSVQTSHDSQSMTVKYTSPGSYTWSIPSEVDLNNQQSMTVSATKVNEEANASLKIRVCSENGFKMKSSTGRSGAYKITQDGKEVENNSLVLETTSTGTSSTDLKFFAYPGNFMTAGTYNDTLTFKAQNGYVTGTVLEIEGMKFIVMEQTNDDTYMLIDGKSIGNIQYQPNQNANGDYEIGAYDTPNDKRFDGQYSNTYEGSYIDNYLENTWYKQLPDKLQQAILETEIKQKSINCDKTNSRWMSLSPTTSPPSPDGIIDWYYNSGTKENPNLIRWNKVVLPDNETGVWQYDGLQTFDLGYNGQSYNTIKRHVYLPSINEIAELVNLNSANKVYDFLKGTNNQLEFMWLRDSAHYTPMNSAYLHYKIRSFNTYIVTDTTMGVRPAFVVDLSKIDYSVTGKVNYK
ncbi:DUF6273 domain-containing protein [uncultured Holdemanella sp.]|uniref:DUF6273 domain-containing protein n=1 Tax=uncultured Holdemanella sp. TaxID=1763549 RepID=UPI00258747F7|nr:DUF6273 domain-containing protein [uncultured Holdemanella sp.]